MGVHRNTYRFCGKPIGIVAINRCAWKTQRVYGPGPSPLNTLSRENGKWKSMYPHYSFFRSSEYTGSYSFGPAPCELDEKAQQRIIDAGQLVLRARERHPEGSLAEHYNPLAMDQTLLKAHDEMDREVNKAFGGARKLTNERQRQELLFASYGELSRG